MNRTDDEKYLNRALKLARKGRGWVSPNPLVGSVVVKDGKIVGEGYHQRFGGDHAEIVALKAAGEKAQGATLYVNLEPCCHYGKTPPCVNAILEAGIKRVVMGTIDPNPLVNCKGMNILKSRGVEVQIGPLEEQCRELNQGYFKYITTGLPLVTLKMAQSLDGRIATASGSSQWISSFISRKMAHTLRSETDAVMVGVGTVLADDPQLTVRHVKGINPLRVVVDSRLRIPLRSRLLSDEEVKKTIIATTKKAPPNLVEAIKAKGARVWTIDTDREGRVDLKKLWHKLGQEGVTSVLVEGGSQVFTSILRAGLADRIITVIAPIFLGKGIEAVGDLGVREVSQAVRVHHLKMKWLGDDIMLSGEFQPSQF